MVLTYEIVKFQSGVKMRNLMGKVSTLSTKQPKNFLKFIANKIYETFSILHNNIHYDGWLRTGEINKIFNIEYDRIHSSSHEKRTTDHMGTLFKYNLSYNSKLSATFNLLHVYVETFPNGR